MTDHLNKFVRGGAEFTVDLLDNLKESIEAKENVLVSPLFIQTCMALAFTGAKGDTATEISHVMKYHSKHTDKVAINFKHVLDKYRESPNLKMANKIYKQMGHQIKSEYSHFVKNNFDVESEGINFSEIKKTPDTINSWAKKQIGDQITDLIEADSLDAQTHLILLNALHFKGEWKEEFHKSRTEVDDFWISANESVKVKFMSLTTVMQICYIYDLDCRALEMPYKDSDLSMFALLPRKRDGLLALIKKLKSVNLLELSKKLEERYDVEIKFPKFQIEYSMESSNVLKPMGIKKVFSPHADLSNMFKSSDGIYISKFFHKTSIVVNEKGLEAEELTYKRFDLRTPPRFEADHPFLYFIWNRKNILFAGAFVNAPKNLL